MLMQSTRSNGVGNLGRLLGLGLRLEGEADLEPVLPRGRATAAGFRRLR